MNPKRIWLTAAGCLLLIWSAVAWIMKETDHLVSWPEKVMDLAAAAPWLDGTESTYEQRQQHLDRVITNLNRLDAPQKRRLREDGQEMLERFFASLSEEEQKEYVDRTVDPYLSSLEQALKLLPEEERKRLVVRMRSDLKNLRGKSPKGEQLGDQDREFMESLMAEDPILFLREAPMKTKMELAPLLEDMQARIQGLRR